LNRLKAPEITKKIRPGNIEPAIFRLNDSVPVYMIQAGSQHITKIDLIFKAGAWWQPKSLVASTTNAMLSEGTENYTGPEIADITDYYGAYLNTYTDRDHAFISVYTLSKHLDSIMPVLSEIIKYPSFPETGLKRYLERQKQFYKTEKSRVSSLAREKFLVALYGPLHPYGKQIKPADFDKINSTDLQKFHSKFYDTGNCRIIVSGRFNEKEIFNKLDSLFNGSSLSSVTFPKRQQVKKQPSAKNRIFVPKKGAIQSALRIGKILFNSKNPDYAGMMVLNNILGGHFGSRLMQNIREKKGYAYSIGSVLTSHRNSGYITIISETGTGYGKATIKEIYKELNKLRNKPVSKKELDTTRSHMLGAILRGFDGPFAWSESIKSIIEQDLDTGFFSTLTDTIQSISARQLQELALKYLDPEDMYEVMAGSRE
jgi:zinc protease